MKRSILALWMLIVPCTANAQSASGCKACYREPTLSGQYYSCNYFGHGAVTPPSRVCIEGPVMSDSEGYITRACNVYQSCATLLTNIKGHRFFYANLSSSCKNALLAAVRRI